MTLTSAGALNRVAGTEDLAASAVPPAYPEDELVLAEITVDETATVLINDADIKDVRFFLNLGGGGTSTATDSAYVNVTSDAMTGTLTFSGVTTDFTTGANEHLALIPNGTGNVGIGTTGPGHDSEIGTETYSEIDAGEASFTTSPSRTYKQNIKNVTFNQSILGQIAKIPVTTYDFKPELCNESNYDDKCTNKIGLIAEDFHQIFKRGDEKELSGDEVRMALWIAVQELKSEKDAEIEFQQTEINQLKLQNQELKQIIYKDHPDEALCQ